MKWDKILKAVKFILIFDAIACVIILVPRVIIDSYEPGTHASNPDDVLENLVTGKIAASVPDSMEYNHDYMALATITASMNDSILLEGIDSTRIDSIETIKVSSTMKVSLTDPTGGENFKIQDINSKEQVVSKRSNTVWRWNIRPVKGGNHELLMIASVVIKSKEGDDTKDYQVVEKTIAIHTTLMTSVMEFSERNWHWLLSSILIPLAVYWYKEKTKPKPKKYY